jgi:membrane protein
MLQPMLEWWERFSARPFVAHLLRAVSRFTLRGGVQLAAAITYFSVLSLVPVLMLAFSVLGFTLTVFRPDLLAAIETLILAQVDANSAFGEGLYSLIEQSLTNWAQVGVIGLLFLLWLGSNWVGNLKRATRLLMRVDVDNPGKQTAMPLDILANGAGLLAILLVTGATIATAALATSTTVRDAVGGLLGISDSPGWMTLLGVVGLLASLAIGCAGFRLLFGWFSPAYVPSHLAWVGAGIGSASLLVLQALAGLIFGAFSRNLGFAVFGSTLVLMLFLNMFATLILYVAAWLATSEVVLPEPEPEPALELLAEPLQVRPGEFYVSADVARRSLGIGLGTGYTIGAAAGLGIGALLISALRAVFPRRRE